MNAAVVVATYNERENLPSLVAAILQHPGYNVIVVDDDSPDGTGVLADDLARESGVVFDEQDRDRHLFSGLRVSLNEYLPITRRIDRTSGFHRARPPQMAAHSI